MNIGEVVAYFARAGSTEAQIRRILDPLPIEQIPFDEGLAYSTGLLLPITKPAGLSFGDRACIALSYRLGVKALTADPIWASISDAAGIENELIR